MYFLINELDLMIYLTIYQICHLLKFNKTKWPPWSKWPMASNQLGH